MRQLLLDISVPKGGEWNRDRAEAEPNRRHDVAVETVDAEKARGLSGAAVETVPTKTRRRFTAAEKLRILTAAEAAVASGERGALEAVLRKEGIYSSHLSAWRQQFAAKGSE